MYSITRQPLVHFLVIGFVLFVAFKQFVAPKNEAQKRTVVLSEQVLKQYLQYRSKRFAANDIDAEFKAMSAAEKQRLANDYLREEVLFREANNLSLSNNDFVIRQRLIQKMEFLNRSFVDSATQLSEQQLQGYFEQHIENYRRPAEVSFSHVFLVKGASTEQQQQFNALKQQLNTQGITPEDAGIFGDAFLYNRHYMKRHVDVVSSHFGQYFSDQLTKLVVGNGQWQGPIASDYGWHLVYLIEKKPSSIPELAEIKAQVTADARIFYGKQASEQVISNIVAGYHIVDPANVLAIEQQAVTQ
ncbi:peptidylprolyl isomerase [Thalassotalea sp. G2M2-11]|uniref:peptidylprolyl isomerase n=1 Tax=Thalassotalea sp. G2M2-11 TaxID=2787627 RepID=UPI0019CFDC0C|nr:peptidylprolyl isomerase [Thalassotalea sp. G2M2-11]